MCIRDSPDSFSRKHNATEFRKYIDDHEENFIRFKTNLLLKDAQREDVYKRQVPPIVTRV